MVGWASSKDAGDFAVQKLEFVDGARRFEPGLPDIAAIAGLAKSIETLSSFGWEEIYSRIQSLNAILRAEIPVINREPLQSGIVAFDLENEEKADAVYQNCLKNKVIITKRKKQLRVAAHATSSKKISKFFSKFLKIKGQRFHPFRKLTGPLLTAAHRQSGKEPW